MSQQRQDPELKAIRQIKDALEPLSSNAKKRAIKFVLERLDDVEPQGVLPLTTAPVLIKDGDRERVGQVKG